MIYGAQKYGVRVQVDPDQLAAHNIGIDEVQRRHRDAATPTCRPAGSMATSRRSPSNRTACCSNAAAYRPIIVAWRNGSPVRLEQVANVIDGVDNDKLVGWYNNNRAIILAIQKQPGTNTVEVVDSIRKLLPEFRRSIPPAVHLSVALRRLASRIRGSIRDVEFTLVLTIAVVVLVIFLFLRNVSATLIPGCAVPFSIIGTFAVMYLLGLQPEQSLADGADALGRLRRGRRHRDAGEHRAPHGDGRDAACRPRINASREIGFTILSMTISLVAVFIPVLFLGGIVGRLLHEFSVTIVVAILISGFVSLSLTPMLGSRFLKSDHGVRHGVLYNALEGGFDVLTALVRDAPCASPCASAW